MRKKFKIGPIPIIIFIIILVIVYAIASLLAGAGDYLSSFAGEWGYYFLYCILGIVALVVLYKIGKIALASYKKAKSPDDKTKDKSVAVPSVVVSKPDNAVWNVIRTISLTLLGLWLAWWLYNNFSYNNQPQKEQVASSKYEKIDVYEFSPNDKDYIKIDIEMRKFDFEYSGGTLIGYNNDGEAVRLNGGKINLRGNKFYRLWLKPETFAKGENLIVLKIQYPPE